MKDFDIATPCVKCGYSGNAASVEYRVGRFDPIEQQNISIVTFGKRPIDEYLLRSCQRCGYKWPERTIDIYEVNK